MPQKKDKQQYIHLKGVRVHNLKNIEVKIPLNHFVVITGLSGSGKSSLAFDTIYAEGQRRYVESLSAYARQFLGRMQKPDVDFIEGIPPAIAIEQKVNTSNPRSTVGTSTEIYDYIKLLYARIGKTFSPVSGKEVKKHSVDDVLDFILREAPGKKMMIAVPYSEHPGDSIPARLRHLFLEGFSRVMVDKEIHTIEEIMNNEAILKGTHLFYLIIDRLIPDTEGDTRARMADSVQTAFQTGNDTCTIIFFDGDEIIKKNFSARFEADGIVFNEPSIHMFNFNNPLGACPRCEGYGKVIGIDEDLVVPDKSLSVFEDAIVCWKGEKMKKWKENLIRNAVYFDFPVHKPYDRLTAEQKRLIWTGNKYFKGLDRFFVMLEAKKYKIQYRVMLARYRGKTICPECHGKRLRKEASWVKINGVSIPDLADWSLERVSAFFSGLDLTNHDHKIAERILTEINNRIHYLLQVGLGYLTLNRLSSTLSGGESQRINLATSLGSSLVGSLYILDEPSIGLHPRDTDKLIRVLKDLKELGNTVLVVEHDEDFMKAADDIIDLGPRAGKEGGRIIFAGPAKKIHSSKESLTAQYLTGQKEIPVPSVRRQWNSSVILRGVKHNNLKNIDVTFPLHVLTVVTGVSGSGKSSLVSDTLCPALRKVIERSSVKGGAYSALEGDLAQIQAIEHVDQHPIGKSSRSNPVTYLKAWDDIRKLLADQPMAKHSHLKPAHFSFNVDGGRCDECKGEGVIHVEMQFMADVELVCEHCKGKRFKPEILEVKYRGKSVYDLLELTVNEAIALFSEGTSTTEKKIVEKLQTLENVGMGYVHLGQASNTLSGGESQRIKLASFLKKEQQHIHKLFIFDEPTTGLHFDDIRKLLAAFDALIEHGNTVLLIEHNPEVIKSADWVIDLGPEGGEKGGTIVCEGTPEEIITCSSSHTGRVIRGKLRHIAERID
ncbi:MAG: excinuclease ABC subunit UvrA [Chlorobi bacterium]|nr:excinuclease ABC subunit UvrA [Chlorobiota bacterium]